MALEKKEVQEENGSIENSSQEQKFEEVQRPQSESDIIKDLQEKMALMSMALQQTMNNPGSSQDSTTNQLLKQFINTQTASMTTENGQFKFDDVYVDDQLDPDDVLPKEKWVTFVTHKVMHIIVDDKRNGRNVRAPFDIIAFRYESTKKVVHGRETELLHLSTYTCKSKKELQWLRDHSKFGVTFFDNIKQALTTDVERATKLAKAMVQLQRLGQAAIISMCKERDLPIGNSLDEMRALIAHQTVEQEMSKTQKAIEQATMEQDAEAIMIGKQLVN